MKIRMLADKVHIGDGRRVMTGEEITVDNEIGAKLIENGLAERVGPGRKRKVESNAQDEESASERPH